jgi:hypothetical protein
MSRSRDSSQLAAITLMAVHFTQSIRWPAPDSAGRPLQALLLRDDTVVHYFAKIGQEWRPRDVIISGMRIVHCTPARRVGVSPV